MRDQDVAECLACGINPRAAVTEGVTRSTWSLTALVDGEVAAIFGVAPLGGVLDPRGVPWLLGTPLVPKYRRILARHAAPYIRTMLRAYPHLVNHVHARNTVAVAWIKRMGFTVHDETHPVGPEGEPFHLFEMHTDV